MNILSRITLFFKGMAMGTVDIVPGVSGSTVAVLLNIYERFIRALKNIDGALIKAILRPIICGFSAQSRKECREKCCEADLPWLLNLAAGLACAFVAASMVIPVLMENYPQTMRGFFFGLVLGSIITPVRQIKKIGISRISVCLLFAVLFFFILGQQFSPPVREISIIADGSISLEQACIEHPCFIPPVQTASLSQNAGIFQTAPDLSVPIPAGTPFTITQPYALFCLLAGFIAICAMLLPGISGSFVLLILGSYYFMLSCAKSFMHGLSSGHFFAGHLLLLLCFAVGAALGIAVFSRALTWLMSHHKDMTLAAIIGILFGCLRGVWPFKTMPDNINFIPSASTDGLSAALIAIFCGLALASFAAILQMKLDRKANALPPEN